MHEYQILESGKPLDQASKAMILLHGRGGSAQDIIALSGEFCDETFYIAAPQATNNTWYPYSFMAERKQNEPWLGSAIETVKTLIDEIGEKISLNNIFLVGFSQGACLTLEVATRFADRYAGVIAFTGGLIGASIDESLYQGDFQGTKVYIGNSDIDPHVPLERSRASAELMKRMGADVKLDIYANMPHTITRQEVNAVREFIF